MKPNLCGKQWVLMLFILGSPRMLREVKENPQDVLHAYVSGTGWTRDVCAQSLKGHQGKFQDVLCVYGTGWTRDVCALSV